MSTTLSIGDKVEWTSSSNGRTSTKQGSIVSVVPPRGRTKMDEIAKQHNAVSEYGGGIWRDHESYVILVPPATPRSKGKLYWPLVSKLRKM